MVAKVLMFVLAASGTWLVAAALTAAAAALLTPAPVQPAQTALIWGVPSVLGLGVGAWASWNVDG